MKKILVIDDEPSLRETLVDILELSGYVVKSANNGRDGYAKIVEFNPELVVCDVNMPEMSGFELLNLLNKELTPDKVPPFLFVTAKTEKKSIDEALSLGAIGYILKPFDHQDIIKAIQTQLN